jgi:hypothetical protein
MKRCICGGRPEAMRLGYLRNSKRVACAVSCAEKTDLKRGKSGEPWIWTPRRKK